MFDRGELPKFLTEPDPIGTYNSTNYTVVDFETTTYNNGLAVYDQNKIVLACWRNGPDHPRPGLFYKFGGEFELQQLVDDINDADFMVAHNSKFELQWLQRCGLDLTTVVHWDTMIAEYVEGGNRWLFGRLALDEVAWQRLRKRKIHLIRRMFSAGIDTQDIPLSWLLRYCVRDVELTEQVFHHQLRTMESKKVPVVYTRCLLTPVLADIEHNGMQLDTEAVQTRAQELEQSYIEVSNALENFAAGVNFNSGPQLAEFLYDTLGFTETTDRRGEPNRTPAGRPKTDTDTIKQLKPRNKRQRKFLELYHTHNAVWTELSKYMRKFNECCEQDGGLLLAQFNQTNTRTHRLSSSGLGYKTQFQNFPRAYKPLFLARREGWVVGEADGAQLEFRVAGHLGRDSQVLEDLVNNEDIHSVTAQIITENGEPTDRQNAKAHTFKPLYGGTSGTRAQQAYYEAFKRKYAGVAAAQSAWVNEALRTGKVETEWGMTYHYPGTKVTRSGYITNTTSICNYQVQAFATAEIIPIALVYFWHYLKRSDLQMFIVNTIHDSIITELPVEETEAFHELAQRCLIEEVYAYLNDVYGVKLTVPLGTGVMQGPSWSGKDAKASEVKYEAPHSLYVQEAA